MIRKYGKAITLYTLYTICYLHYGTFQQDQWGIRGIEGIEKTCDLVNTVCTVPFNKMSFRSSNSLRECVAKFSLYNRSLYSFSRSTCFSLLPEVVDVVVGCTWGRVV